MHYRITYRNSMSEMAVDYIEADDSKPLALVKAVTKWQTSTVKSGKTDRSPVHLDEIEMISEAWPAIEENEVLYRAMYNLYQYQMGTVFGLKEFSSAEDMLYLKAQSVEVKEFLRAYIKAWESFDKTFVWEFIRKWDQHLGVDYDYQETDL